MTVTLATATTTLAAPPAEIGLADDLAQQVNETLGLNQSLIFTMEIDLEPGVPVFALVPLEGQMAVLDLAPQSTRAASYQIFGTNADGSLRAETPSIERTLAGEIVGVPFSRAAGSMMEDGLYARIGLPNGNTYWIEPLGARFELARPDDYVLYASCDVQEHGRSCGADMLRAHPEAPAPGEFEDGGVLVGNEMRIAELACDADYEYFLDWGSVTNVENRINLVINVMNNQYEGDVGITHEITAIIVRDNVNDPYTTTNPSALLNQFRNWWLGNHGNIHRDVAQLFTGKNLVGGVIGIAWLGGVCNSFGFSLVESDFTGSFACVTDLSAHELGHNWNADHCNCSGWTMNPSITCANRFHGTWTVPQIISFRNSINWCLDDPVVDPTFAELTDMEITLGSLNFGSLNGLRSSDNARIGIQSQRGFTAFEANVNEVVVGATSPFPVISELNVMVEGVVTQPNGTAYIRMQNYNTGNTPTIATFDMPQSETLFEFLDLNNPNRFVDNANDDRIEIMVKVVMAATFTPEGFACRYDWVAFSVLE